jgi:hypothetical protein
MQVDVFRWVAKHVHRIPAAFYDPYLFLQQAAVPDDPLVRTAQRFCGAVGDRSLSHPGGDVLAAIIIQELPLRLSVVSQLGHRHVIERDLLGLLFLFASDLAITAIPPMRRVCVVDRNSDLKAGAVSRINHSLSQHIGEDHRVPYFPVVVLFGLAFNNSTSSEISSLLR